MTVTPYQIAKYFNKAREKPEKWADDMVLAAEKALKDTKEQIKLLQRQARNCGFLRVPKLVFCSAGCKSHAGPSRWWPAPAKWERPLW